MRQLFVIIFSAIILSGISGCASVVRSMYGMKKYKELNDVEIERAYKTYKVPQKEILVLDTSYFSFLSKFKADHTFSVDNHVHPLQALWYDKNGKQISFHSGVWADARVFSLKWNYKNQFDVYPPKTGAPLDTIFGFEDHLKHVKYLDGRSVDPALYRDADFNVIVHFARFTGRMNRSLLRTVKRNAALNRRFKVNYVYVNTDNFYYDRSSY